MPRHKTDQFGGVPASDDLSTLPVEIGKTTHGIPRPVYDPRAVDFDPKARAKQEAQANAKMGKLERKFLRAEGIIPSDTCTIPEALRDIEKKVQVKPISVIARMHPRDHPIIKRILKKDRLTFQKFFDYCLGGYMSADPYFLRFLKFARQADAVPTEMRDNHVLSFRERSSIFDEIEREEKGEK